MALQAHANSEMHEKGAYFLYHWDPGASSSIFPNKDDFLGPMTYPGIGIWLKCIIKGLWIQGKVMLCGQSWRLWVSFAPSKSTPTLCPMPESDC